MMKRMTLVLVMVHLATAMVIAPQSKLVTKEEAYTVDHSCRFNDDDSAQLSKPGWTGGDKRKWTLSVWLKLGNLGQYRGIFGAGYGTGPTHFTNLRFGASDELIFQDEGTNYVDTSTEGKYFRNIGSWMNVVVKCDTDQGVASNRLSV